MKRTVLFIVFLAMMLGMSFTAQAATFIIGDGTSTQSYIPFYGYYDYSWSKVIYTAAEMAAAGMTAGDINGIGYYVGNTPVNYVSVDQRVYMRHTTAVEYASTDNTYPDNTAFGQVFQGDYTWNGEGWHNVIFSSAFNWNGTDGVEILWENWDGVWASGPNFRYTSTTPVYKAVYKYADVTFPVTAGTLTYNRANIAFITPSTDPIFSIAPLSWDFGQVELGLAATKEFTITNNGGGSLDLTSVTIAGDYYSITIPPTDMNLAEYESTSFTVEFAPTIVGTHLGTVTIVHNLGTATVDLTGEGYVRPPGSTCGNPYPITLPLVDFVDDTALYGDDYSSTWITPSSSYLNGDDMVLQFTLTEASTLSGDLTALTGSWIGMFILDSCPDPDTPAPVLRSATTSSTSLTMTPVDLAAGSYFVILSTWPSPQSFQFSLNLSAVPLPTDPEFSITPTSKDFGIVFVGSTASQTFTVTNTGQGALGITSIDLTAGDTGYFSILNNTYTAPLGFNESFTFDVQFAPTMIGDFAVTLTVTDDLAKVAHDVPITGTGYDATVYPPYAVDFAIWPVPDWTQLSFFYGDPPATGTQWFQDDWLNVTDPLNKAAKINIYGTTRHGWLITPPIDFGTRGDFELVFDAGLVAWNQTTPPTGTQDDDRFIVFISDDPMMADAVILREWNNTGSAWVFNEIPATGATFTIPINGVTGIKYLAFYGESTVSNGDNDLMIDNVYIAAAQEPPTPVELSSFTATLTAQNYVQISWTSQSESQMVGYRVYRGTSNDQAVSSLISNSLIPATNTSTTQTYSVVDAEVEIGNTYYYWLESVDYQNSDFHGPVSVIVEGNVPPVLPNVTSMKNAYPNPFRANTVIEVALKAGETGTVTIYNVAGQVVRSYSVTEGYHNLNWNGRDANGQACGSGIYFYKLSTPSVSQTRKMMLVK
ncbi:MAG: choice-of-anchor D domain-containing protein [Candidatus Syntrophosphaera sp.]|nr:choice-of-anchor D domain-containing protein [Candidatus Syntrophosphaera sp.]